MNYYDPDAASDRAQDMKDLDKLLAALQGCDLQRWDEAFVNDLTDRIEKYGDRIRVSALQWEQLERMRSQYNVSI